MYVCISYRKLYACRRIILHSLKYHVIKPSNKKNGSALGCMQRLDDLCLLLSTDIGSTSLSESVLDSEGSQQKGAGSVFQGGGLQVADLKAEVGELRAGGISPI